MPGAKDQKAVHACMIRLLNLEPEAERRPCGSCFAAEQFIDISITSLKDLYDTVKCTAGNSFHEPPGVPGVFPAPESFLWRAR